MVLMAYGEKKKRTLCSVSISEQVGATSKFNVPSNVHQWQNANDAGPRPEADDYHDLPCCPMPGVGGELGEQGTTGQALDPKEPGPRVKIRRIGILPTPNTWRMMHVRRRVHAHALHGQTQVSTLPWPRGLAAATLSHCRATAVSQPSQP